MNFPMSALPLDDTRRISVQFTIPIARGRDPIVSGSELVILCVRACVGSFKIYNYCLCSGLLTSIMTHLWITIWFQDEMRWDEWSIQPLHFNLPLLKIFNICTEHTSPPSLLPWSQKVRLSIHYPRIISLWVYR